MEKSGVSKNIDLFEKTFEDLDVQVSSVTGALDSVGAQTAEDQDAVSQLLAQMQAESAMGAGQAIGGVNQAQI